MRKVIWFCLLFSTTLFTRCNSVKLTQLTADNISEKLTPVENDRGAEFAFDYQIGKLGANGTYFNDRFPILYSNVQYTVKNFENGSGRLGILDREHQIEKSYTFHNSKLVNVIVGGISNCGYLAQNVQVTCPIPQIITEQILDAAIKSEGYLYLSSKLKDGKDKLIKQLDDFYLVGEITKNDKQQITLMLFRAWRPI